MHDLHAGGAGRAGSSRARLGSISTAAASASAGSAERSPTTPFCTSEVTMAVCGRVDEGGQVERHRADPI